MSSTLAGDPTNYPTLITIPSDGDGPGITAADVNVALEGLADRTAYLSYYSDRLAAIQPLNIVSTVSTVVQMVGDATSITFVNVGASADTCTRNFGSWIVDGFRAEDVLAFTGTVSNNVSGYSPVSVTATVLTMGGDAFISEGPVTRGAVVATTGPMQGAVFDVRLGRWYAYGSTCDLRYSTDHGATWSTRVAFSAGTVDESEHLTSGAVDPVTSNAVFSTSNTVSTDRYVLRVTDGGTTVTRVDAHGSLPGGTGSARVVWEPVTGRFVWIYLGTARKCFYSTTGATWLAGGDPPAGWNDAVIPTMATNGLGRIVAIARSAATTWEVMTSDNGGTTWTARTDITTVLATGTRASLTYEAESETWLWCVGEVSGTYSSTIYQSTDNGVTWTVLLALTGVCLIGLAVDGTRVWSAVALSATFSPRLVYSVDEGLTWRTTGHTLSSTAADVGGTFYGGGRFCVVSADKLRMTAAAGLPTIGTVT